MPATAASLCVPVEISRPKGRGPTRARAGTTTREGEDGRWFRLAIELSPDEILLRTPLPRELGEGPLRARLQLPPPIERLATLGSDWLGEDGSAEVTVLVTAAELRVALGTERERAELRLLRIVDLPAEARAAITRYVELRTSDAY